MFGNVWSSLPWIILTSSSCQPSQWRGQIYEPHFTFEETEGIHWGRKTWLKIQSCQVMEPGLQSNSECEILASVLCQGSSTIRNQLQADFLLINYVYTYVFWKLQFPHKQWAINVLAILVHIILLVLELS